MKNESNKKLIFSLLISGIVGAGILYRIQAEQSKKTPVLRKIGKTITDVGHMIENCSECSTSDVMDHIEKKLPRGADILHSINNWVDAGMTLWEKLKKGD
ncbi:MAG: hypothetical protein HY069_02435 [Chlamydiia bacterium]|nr:hypothetical protein [Chlamydiia bacterium]